MNDQINVSKIFQSALQIYKTNFKIYISISLLFSLTTVAISKIFVFENNEDPQAFIFLIVSTLISSWFVISLLYVGAFNLAGKKITFQQALQLPKERYMYYVITNAVFSTLVMFGALLFVIPGIYFAVVYNFAAIITVFEKKLFRDAFIQSAFLVKGYFFNVFAVFIILTGLVLMPRVITFSLQEVIPFLGVALSQIILTFILPFTVIVQIALYLRLTDLKKNLTI